jgi:hypothetical protein
MITSEIASENSALLRSKSSSSAHTQEISPKRIKQFLFLSLLAFLIGWGRSYLFIPPLTRIRPLNIHNQNFRSHSLRNPNPYPSVNPPRDIPLVVCFRLVSSMTSNFVPKRRFNNVPEPRQPTTPCLLGEDTLSSRLGAKDGDEVVSKTLEPGIPDKRSDLVTVR